MSTLDTTRSYEDGEVLVEADLDAFLDDIETFLNTTKINDDNIQNSGITGSTKLLNQSVTAAKLAADSVETLKILDSAVTTAKINDLAVTTAKINDLGVTTGKINDLAVTTGKLAADAVTGAKIADDAVDTEHIADSAVETDQLNASAVTTTKINDGAVTPAKHSTNYVITTTSRTVSDTSGATEATDDIGTFTLSGRPVMILIISGTIAPTAATTAAANEAYVQLERFDGVSTTVVIGKIASMRFAIDVNQVFDFDDSYALINSIYEGQSYQRTFVDAAPAAGSWTYRLRSYVTTDSGLATCTTTSLKTLIYEL